MNKTKVLIILVSVLILTIKCFGQIWPFTQMNRFGNAVYYKIDSISNDQFKTRYMIFDKNIQENYIDLNIINNKIKLTVKNEENIFIQKPAKKKEHKSGIFLYKRRPLYFKRNDSTIAKIDFMKLLEFSKDTLTIMCNYKYRNKDNSYSKTKEVVNIPTDEIYGIYIGRGHKDRIAIPVVSLTIILALGLIISL